MVRGGKITCRSDKKKAQRKVLLLPVSDINYDFKLCNLKRKRFLCLGSRRDGRTTEKISVYTKKHKRELKMKKTERIKLL